MTVKGLINMQHEPPDPPSDPTGALVIRPGDTLLIVVAGPISDQTADAYRGRILAQAPGLADVVVVPAEQVAVYRPDPAPDGHPWQEYNAHGNTCHRAGCTLTEAEHVG